jgi:uncharacterized protein YqgV (UPF0045/DUF77 family)
MRTDWELFLPRTAKTCFWIGKIWNRRYKQSKRKLDSIGNENEQISYLRAKVINALINKSIELYKNNFNTILEGNLEKGLLDIYKSENKALQDIESFSIEKSTTIKPLWKLKMQVIM